MYVEVSVHTKQDLYVQTDSHTNKQTYIRTVTQHENCMYIGKSLVNIPKRAGIYVVKYDK